MSTAKSVTAWVLVLLLALAYGMAGLGKLSGAAVEQFAGWGYAPWFATLIGALELAGAIGLLIPKTTKAAIAGLTVIMLGAAYTHLANGEGADVIRPGIFMALLWAVCWLRGGFGGRAATD